MANHLKILDDAVDGLHDGLGQSRSDTVVIAVTEFGRTARINGTGGTDHGTASTMILAGGALRPGGIVGDWPTLADAKLFENRDLAPTLDVRQVFKGVLRDHLGLETRARCERLPGKLRRACTEWVNCVSLLDRLTQAQNRVTVASSKRLRIAP